MHKKELIGLYLVLFIISTVLSLTVNKDSILVFMPLLIIIFGLFHILSETKKK